MQKYLPFYGVVIGCILIGIVVLGLLILLVKGPKCEQKIKYRYVIPVSYTHLDVYKRQG